MAGRLVLAGYGDIGARVARGIGASRPILALNRSGRQAQLNPPVPVTRCELARAATLLRDGDTVMWLAPPAANAETEVQVEAVLAGAPRLHKVVYLSTSGVYGDCAGRWVQETDPPDPQTPRARRRYSGEVLVTQYGRSQQVPTAIIRVPGIYGPGRLPRRRLQQGLPTLAADLSPWSNRIHAEDLAMALRLLLDRGQGVFNISDGHPGSITEYYQAVAELLGLPHLSEARAAAELTPELASYMRESRRLDITRARTELGYVPRFADFRQALPGCVQDDLHWGSAGDAA